MKDLGTAKRRAAFSLVLPAAIWALAMLLAQWLVAGDNGTTQVLVRSEALKGKAGSRLVVLHQTPLGMNPVRAIGEPTFDDAGECRVELPIGEYAFEVLELRGSTILALRTPLKAITRSTTVEIKSHEPRLLGFDAKEVRNPRIDEFAVRSAATTGELKWEGQGSAAPVLILSPGQTYRVRALGGNDNMRFAIWQVLSNTKTVLRLNGSGICNCTFAIREDGPAIKHATVRLKFPDSEMTFPVNADTVFLTDRRFLSFGYGVELANGRKVGFRPWLGLVKQDQQFQLGGPFQAAAWAKIMVRKPVGGPETQHLVWDANLYDANGHMVVVDRSNIDWQDAIRSTTGIPVPLKRDLTKEEIAGIRALAESFQVDVSYYLDQPVSRTLKPDGFRTYGNRRFYTSAPPHWELQSLNYLARAERVYHMIEDLERKPSKHRVQVRWHAMEGTAWGCGPSGSNAYIMMPFSGLKQSFDYYDSPWALAHEMLHTFGYGHGQRMDVMSSLVGRRFEQYRWYMADHPELDPETAFNGFRTATHVDIANTGPVLPPKAKAKGKGKGGTKKKKKK